MENKKRVAIIQARMGSTRLSNKMLLSLHGKPIIEWVVKRVQKAKLIDKIIVATPDTRENDILAECIKTLGVDNFRGSEDNVLERFFYSARNTDATHIIRVCADNPLIDGEEIDNLINFYFKNPCDYAYNHIPQNNLYPDGLGAEMISYKLLKKLYETVKNKRHKEHCFSYITDNHSSFNIKTFNPLNKILERPDLRFDIDTFDDYYKLSMLNININTTSSELINLYLENDHEYN